MVLSLVVTPAIQYFLTSRQAAVVGH
jgi:hypothetical protein